MTRTLLRIALASHRVGALLTTLIATLFALGNVLGFAQVAGGSPQERAIFGQQMELLGRQLSYLLPLPRDLDTLAGYVQWRHFGNLPLVYAFWALVAGSGAGRGDEERGLVSQWLAAGVPRLAYLGTRAVAFALVCGASVAVMATALIVASLAVDDPLRADAVALQASALLALALCCYGIGVLVAQLTGTRRAAIGSGGALLLALFLMNSLARTGAGPEAIRTVSPFYAYERTTPLERAGGFDLLATLALVASGTLLVAVAAVLFRVRDVGEPVLRVVRAARVTRLPAGDPLLRVPVLAIVAQQKLAIAGWAIGLSILTAFLISMTRAIVDGLSQVPMLRAYLERAGAAAYETFIGVIWLSTMLLLLSLFAIAQVSGWVADDGEGRLDTVLAQPVSRTRVVLERLLATLVGAAVVVAVVAVVGIAAASGQGVELDRGEVAVAAVLLLGVVLAFAALGGSLAAWRPRVAVPLLSVVAIYSYFAQQFAPLFEWPAWVADSSIYGMYGTPLGGEIDRSGAAALAAIGLVGTMLAVGAMQRRDIGR